MRVAALYDIHANLPALEAVLAEIRGLGVDQVIVGGDVLPGPMPRETLNSLFDLDIPIQFLYGNGETAVLEQRAGRDPGAVPEQYRPIIRWTARQLDSEHERRLREWPLTLSTQFSGLGEVLFCHATPQNENDSFTYLTPAEQLLPIFKEVHASVVVCGHTHMPFDRVIGDVRVVNAGSVGMPFGRTGADWLLLGPEIEFRHTDYDLAAAAGHVRGTSYPQAHEFAAKSILEPPAAKEMLKLFTRFGTPC